jgi:hypothetical protein
MSRMRSTDQISKVVEWIDGATIHRSTGFEEGEGATTGFAWSLYDFNLNLLTKLIPIVSREISTSSHKEVKALKQSLGNLFLWGDGFRDGRLQSILEESDDLKETVLSSLVGIGRLLISSESSLVTRNTLERLTYFEEIAVRVRSTSTDEGVEALVRELTILLEKARIIENEFDSEGVYDGDNTDLEDYEYHNELSMSINSLATYTTCLMDLLPSMEDTLNFASLAEDEDQSPSPLDFHVSGPARTYILNIFDRFSKANSQLVERLGEANWQRHIALRNGLVKEVVSAAVAIEEAPKSVFVPVSLFQDSGHGTSLPAHISYAATSASHTSFVSNQSNEEGGGLRVPPTPKAVSKGIPFTCGICGQTLSKIKNRIDWKYDNAPQFNSAEAFLANVPRRHVFADLKPYICTFSDCKDTLRTFPTRKLWEAHEFDHHRFDAVICCSVCPSKFPTKDEIQTHLRAKHKKLLEMKKALGISLGLREQRQPQEATSLSCPLCLCIPGKSRRNFVTHVGKHMESIALAALPRENGSDSESDSDHESATTAFVRGIPNEYVNDSIPTTTNVYGCGYCDYEPSSEDNWKASSALARHVRREHSHQKKINYESDTEGEKSHPRRNSWDSGVGSATASDRASLGTADDEDELELAQAVPPPIHAASSATTAGADFALAELQSSLEYENLKKQKNT